jgi:O-antigen/teichoic acid export membrane protein
VLPWLLLSYGFFGIFGSYGIAAAAGIIAVTLLCPVPFTFSIDFGLLRSLFKFSMYNYLSYVFIRTRELVLPLLVIYLMGARHTAYFYLAFNVTLVFLLVPKAVSKALLAEASHQKSNIRTDFRKGLLISLVSAAAGAVFFFIAGKYVLLLYGAEYVENSLGLLYVFAVIGIFATVNELYYTLMRINMKLNQLLAAQVINVVLTLGLAAVLIGHGIVGVGYAWLISEVVVMVFVLSTYWGYNPVRVMLT